MQYDVIVIGGGHAGYEAALASANMGIKTLILTTSVKSIARLSCNPAIGGIAKGHLVREIDALGGIMAKAIDRTGIQFRMLNKRKGPAVWAPRAQADKNDYPAYIQNAILNQSHLDIKEAMVDNILFENGKINGIALSTGEEIECQNVVVCTGTFLNGLMHAGTKQSDGGRIGEIPSKGISVSLSDMGIRLGRLKTGTPARLDPNSIQYDVLTKQLGDESPTPFSFSTEKLEVDQKCCWLTRTTDLTKKIILENLHLSPMYSGQIKGIGPRYCPSIEDKIVRFQDKKDHQIFLEPEDKENSRVYVNGTSTSLPEDVQVKMIQSVIGLEEAQIQQFGYAVEYDFAFPNQLGPTLEFKRIDGLFLAGQINGTSGYEEAINAALKVKKEPELVLGRSVAYIGVLIDDLITKDIFEPYRMFTSRAEHRLLLRQDNADMRLSEYGKRIGLLEESPYQKFKYKQRKIDEEVSRLKTMRTKEGQSLYQELKKPENRYENLTELYSEFDSIDNDEVIRQVEILIKYEGYIAREHNTVDKMKRLENMRIPESFSYTNVKGLGKESIQKLEEFRPSTLAQAGRIAGVNPSDIQLITVWLHRDKEAKKKSQSGIDNA